MPLHHACRGILKVAREKSQLIHLGQQIHIFADLYSSLCAMLHSVICHGCLATCLQGRRQSWSVLKYFTSTVGISWRLVRPSTAWMMMLLPWTSTSCPSDSFSDTILLLTCWQVTLIPVNCSSSCFYFFSLFFHIIEPRWQGSNSKQADIFKRGIASWLETGSNEGPSFCCQAEASLCLCRCFEASIREIQQAAFWNICL